MRCSPKLCIGLLIVGIGGAALLAYSGNAKAAYALSFLPILACPLMCLIMLMSGRKCDDGECHAKKQISPPR
jgi:hypothetical protein